jgi:copper chaperone
MITTAYQVEGMTCAHCVTAVRTELGALDGISEVTVVLNAGGTSSVTVTSHSPVPQDDVIAALDEAGDYHLVGAHA